RQDGPSFIPFRTCEGVGRYMCPGLRPRGVLAVRRILVTLDYSVAVDGELALALLVPRVLTDDHDAAVATNHLALVADLLNAGVNLHVVLSLAVLVPLSPAAQCAA